MTKNRTSGPIFIGTVFKNWWTVELTKSTLFFRLSQQIPEILFIIL